ncbi:hira-interacting protein 5 [Diplodia corticola]|uniref:Hira-interacting protein 5 n=1 Tax=Diplodia corticola TaxID=236234 RepID=A0A1J9RZU3_9PEZI|nr:hira-interacting protein 5 [Diplodia corticola]OJD33292.1 hira-interacting protein 5 [Diplodia corticola]
MSTSAVPRTAIRALTRARPSTSSRTTQKLATARPTQRCLHQASSPASFVSFRHRPSQSSIAARHATRYGAVESRRTMFIQTENTPNPDALKFNPHMRVLPEDFPSTFLEYMNPRSTVTPPYSSPLAANLHNVDGITSVFFGADYITVTKDSSVPWAHIKPEVFSLISEHVASGQPMVNVTQSTDGDGQESAEDSLAYNEDDDEIVGMIKELLETRIRPAIQEDGGDIEFRGFHDGIVMLKLRGACRTCDSSTVTLKNGIESMLMHYLSPDVTGVEQVLDEEEEVALKEFARFEEKLRQQKGPDATASTVGKGSLDTVE